MKNFSLRTLVAIICLFPSLVLSQEISKEEILSLYKEKAQMNKLEKEMVFAKKHMQDVSKFIKQLKKEEVTNIIVYSERLPDHIVLNDPCDAFQQQKNYVFWQKNKKTFLKKISGSCEFDIVETSKGIINYSNQNIQNLKKDFFMDVIISASLSKDNGIRLSRPVIKREPKYQLYIEIDGAFNCLNFGKAQLTNTRGLFTEYNQKLNSFKLIELIRKEIQLLPSTIK